MAFDLPGKVTIHAVTDEEYERALELGVIGCRFLPASEEALTDPRAKRDPTWGQREITLRPLLWGNYQLCIGPRGCEIGFDDSWMYASLERAVYAMNNWMPFDEAWGNEEPPEGWHRHDSTGERRKLWTP